jgi:cysteinyl-tRNA synthetase
VRKLEDDFNIPEALAVFFTFIKYVNTWIRNNEFALEELISILDMFKTFDSVLWIFDFFILDETEIPWDILEKLELRNKSKEDKNFELADKLRDEITKAWYNIVDSKDGSRVEKI